MAELSKNCQNQPAIIKRTKVKHHVAMIYIYLSIKQCHRKPFRNTKYAIICSKHITLLKTCNHATISLERSFK